MIMNLETNNEINYTDKTTKETELLKSVVEFDSYIQMKKHNSCSF